jgi:transposase-like protein
LTDTREKKTWKVRPIENNHEAQAVPSAAVKPRRKFDPAFRRDAVALWLSGGKSARQVAQELGLLENRLYAWQRRYAPAIPCRHPPCGQSDDPRGEPWAARAVSRASPSPTEVQRPTATVWVLSLDRTSMVEAYP